MDKTQLEKELRLYCSEWHVSRKDTVGEIQRKIKKALDTDVRMYIKALLTMTSVKNITVDDFDLKYIKDKDTARVMVRQAFAISAKYCENEDYSDCDDHRFCCSGGGYFPTLKEFDADLAETLRDFPRRNATAVLGRIERLKVEIKKSKGGTDV